MAKIKELYSEQFKLILEKTVGKHTFTLELHARPDEDFKYVETYDYIISGPNWLSGYLKAQGYSEMEVFEYWEQVTITDANNAWEAYHERQAGA